MNRYHVLFVEDMDGILEHNKRMLESDGYLVSTAKSLAEARNSLAISCPDIVVLDIMLPDGSGIDLCKEIRNIADVPVIFLTCLGESQEVVRGLNAGGDDYITKPYDSGELKARIEAVLRRLGRTDKLVLQSGGNILTLDMKQGRAYIDGEDLLLKPKEYKLLYILIKNRDRYLTAEELYTDAWGMTHNKDIRTVRVHISTLREKLSPENKAWGMSIAGNRYGYRLFLNSEKESGAF